MSHPAEPLARPARFPWRMAGGWAAVVIFALLVGRFWDPCFGFTRFLQFDSSDAAIAIPEIRQAPVYVYAGNDGYDGTFYAEIAFHPLLDSPELKTAIGNLPYRARRILASAMAWVVAGGRASRIAHAYAALNLAIWPAFALLVWSLLPVRDGRSWWVWLGLLFSAGVLHSVRLALTDLLGVALFAAAMGLAERRRRGPLAVLALGGLARETILVWVVAFWRGPWTSGRAWLANLLRLGAAASPLVVWVIYVRWKAGPAPQGWGNFGWPVVAWLEKWSDAVRAFWIQPEFFWLDLATLLALIGLSAQAFYFARRPRLENPWWRVGATGGLMMMCLGHSVWEGNPGAALRVLLPMSLAFAVLVVRDRAGWKWVILGNLSVLSGVLALWSVPRDPRVLATGSVHGRPYVIRLADGWFGCEQYRSKVWAWSPERGELRIESWPAQASPQTLRLGLRALAPREVEIQSGGAILWRGPVGTRLRTIEVDGVPAGASELEITAEGPPVREGAAADARELGVAVYNPAIIGP